MASIHEWVDARTTIGTMLVTAVLSVATGILNINSPVADGVLAPYIPDTVHVATGLTGTLAGLPLLANVLGLRRHCHAVWYSIAMMFPVTTV